MSGGMYHCSKHGGYGFVRDCIDCCRERTAPNSEAASNWQLAQKLAKEKFLLDFMKFLGLDEYIENKIKEHTEAYHD